MKIYIALAALLGILGIGAVVYLGKDSGGGAVTPTLIATATTLKTDLFLKPAGQEEKQAGKRESVRGGDTLRTSGTGRALVEQEGGTATVLDYDTTFTLSGDETHTSGMLAAGGVWARVEKLFGQGEFYEIETQNAVAVVRGTSFGVLLSGGVSSIIVASGTVAVIPKDEATGRRQPNEQVLLTADKKATVDNGKITVSPLTTADKQSEWYRFNNPNEKSVGAKPANIPIKTETPKLPVEVPVSVPTITTPVVIGPTISSVLPAKTTQGGSVTVKGTGFLKVTTVIIGKETLPASAVRILDDKQIEINTTSIPIGTWIVFVVDINQQQASLQNALTVEARVAAPVSDSIPGTYNPNDPTGSKP